MVRAQTTTENPDNEPEPLRAPYKLRRKTAEGDVDVFFHTPEDMADFFEALAHDVRNRERIRGEIFLFGKKLSFSWDMLEARRDV